jgi:hypothetical protein
MRRAVVVEVESSGSGGVVWGLNVSARSEACKLKKIIMFL